MHPWAGLAKKKKARRFPQFELKVGELRFPIHFVCVSAALPPGVRGCHFPLRWIWPISGPRSPHYHRDLCRPHICPKRKAIFLPSRYTSHPAHLNSNEMRLLGVIVDNQLSWSSKVNPVKSNVCQKIGILGRKNKEKLHLLSPSAPRLFYLAIIQPGLQFAPTATISFMSISLRDRLCSAWRRRAVRCDVAGADWQAEVNPILKTHR